MWVFLDQNRGHRRSEKGLSPRKQYAYQWGRTVLNLQEENFIL